MMNCLKRNNLLLNHDMRTGLNTLSVENLEVYLEKCRTIR